MYIGMAYPHLSNMLVIKSCLDHRVLVFSIRGCDIAGDEATRELISFFFLVYEKGSGIVIARVDFISVMWVASVFCGVSQCNMLLTLKRTRLFSICFDDFFKAAINTAFACNQIY